MLIKKNDILNHNTMRRYYLGISLFMFLFICSCSPYANIREADITQRRESGEEQKQKRIKSKDGRYIAHGDGTVRDTKTGLMWAQKDSFADSGLCLDWNASKDYVNRLNTGGYRDWRVPSTRELKEIYEKSKEDVIAYMHDSEFPLHLDRIFSDGAAYWYWSSEDAGSCCVYSMLFLNGGIFKNKREQCGGGGVRAVRLQMNPLFI